MQYLEGKNAFSIVYSKSSELLFGGSPVHSFSRVRTKRIPVVAVLLRLGHELLLGFHDCSERDKEFFVVAPMGSFDQILSDVPVRIVAIDIRIEFPEYIIPFPLFSLASGEELRSSVRVNMNTTGYPMIPEMRENEHKKLESECGALSPGVCHESAPGSNIHDVPLVEREMLVVLEVVVHLLRKGLRIGKDFGIEMHILERSDCPVVVERSGFSVLRTHLLYLEAVSFVDSFDPSEREVSELLLSSEHHNQFLGSYFHFLKVREDFDLFFLTRLFRMRARSSRHREQECSEGFDLAEREGFSGCDLFPEFPRGPRLIEIHDIRDTVPVHMIAFRYTHNAGTVPYTVYHNPETDRDCLMIFAICFVTHRVFGYDMHTWIR